MIEQPFVDGPKSKELRNAVGYGKRGVSYRIEDEKAFDIISSEDVLKSIGAPGKLSVVDTVRCFHFGARTFEAERLMMICTFAYPTRSDFRRQTYPLKFSFENSKHKNDRILRLIFAGDSNA